MKYLLVIAAIFLISPNVRQTPDPIKPYIATQEGTYYQVGPHYYDIDTIAFAVAIREAGRNRIFKNTGRIFAVCGIKSRNEYELADRDTGLRRCSSLLNRTFARARGYRAALSTWKNGHPIPKPEEREATEKYTQDIIKILSNISSK